MSSAGSATVLFGERRTVLVVDLSNKNPALNDALSVISKVELGQSEYSDLLKFLSVYHSPPDTNSNLFTMKLSF